MTEPPAHERTNGSFLTNLFLCAHTKRVCGIAVSRPLVRHTEFPPAENLPLASQPERRIPRCR